MATRVIESLCKLPTTASTFSEVSAIRAAEYSSRAQCRTEEASRGRFQLPGSAASPLATNASKQNRPRALQIPVGSLLLGFGIRRIVLGRRFVRAGLVRLGLVRLRLIRIALRWRRVLFVGIRGAVSTRRGARSRIWTGRRIRSRARIGLGLRRRSRSGIRLGVAGVRSDGLARGISAALVRRAALVLLFRGTTKGQQTCHYTQCNYFLHRSPFSSTATSHDWPPTRKEVFTPTLFQGQTESPLADSSGHSPARFSVSTHPRNSALSLSKGKPTTLLYDPEIRSIIKSRSS